MIIMDSKAQLTVDVIAKVAQGKVSIIKIKSKIIRRSRLHTESQSKDRYHSVRLLY
jgi:hypothetical protein